MISWWMSSSACPRPSRHESCDAVSEGEEVKLPVEANVTDAYCLKIPTFCQRQPFLYPVLNPGLPNKAHVGGPDRCTLLGLHEMH